MDPPLSPRPQQVGPQHNGDVTGGHLVDSLLLREERQELDEVPERGRDGVVAIKRERERDQKKETMSSI